MKNLELKINQNLFKRNQAISLLLLIFSFITFSFSSFANPNEEYNKANAFYAEGKYDEAVTAYEALIEKDELSTFIYYNLGNAYYKKNEITLAILNYERALKLQPDNEDALFNLNMANKQTIDKIERLPELFISNTWKNLVSSKTLNDWTYFTIALLFLSLTLFVAYLLMHAIFIKKISFYSGSFFLALTLFCWLMAVQRNKINLAANEAIIFEQTITIQSEPNATAEKLFTLHEGTKVTLLEKVNTWSKIKLPNGNVGWVPTDAIVAI
jgi:tetratricopeptide (TPR) repeat protein